MTTAISSINAIIPRLPSGAMAEPDNDRYKCRFKIKSQSSNKLYLISYDTAQGCCCWKCSCPGNIRHGTCKHLNAMGLIGRAAGRDNKTFDKLRSLGII